ncbi:CRISPR-associated endonuclease Cas6 [Rudanella lutea]|uniref:CRISPR-associated endonuclease Cas6 n=1 Tax=Rudanella lutea TaxID=451374 RepID=UPI00035FB592|nr:CRISPR-associated endonuclease Cas6 [Rudanella lutea]
MPSTTTLPLTTITFPEIALRTRDAHKLRGYFGDLFREYSPLLHNHLEADNDEVKFRYAYPLVQYKVLDRVPTLVGAGEGAGLLAQLFLKIRQLRIDEADFPVLSKHIRHEQATLGISDDLIDYRFETRWMALNQANYRDYQRYTPDERQAQLKRILTSQLLATFREFGLWLEPTERVMVRLRTEEHTTQFKNQTMVVFSGGFTTNVILPDGLGMGKAVSRGFGTILKSERVKE